MNICTYVASTNLFIGLLFLILLLFVVVLLVQEVLLAAHVLHVLVANFLVWNRVARWYIFKPKNPIWVIFSRVDR
jgi:hypothetical protein